MSLHIFYPIGRLPFWDITKWHPESINFWELFWTAFSSKKTFITLFEKNSLEEILKLHPDYHFFLDELEKATEIFARSVSEFVEPPEIFDAHLIYYRCVELLEWAYQCEIQLIGDHPFSFEEIPRLFSHFFWKYINSLPYPAEDDIWCFHLRSPNDIYQFESMIAGLQRKRSNFRLPKIIFTLHCFLEFENPDTYTVWLKDHVAERYVYEVIHNKREYDSLIAQYLKKDVFHEEAKMFSSIFGKSFCALPFFSDGCAWRKCAFCNIGRMGNLHAKTRQEKEEIVHKNIIFLRKNKIDGLSIVDPSISLNDLLLIADVFEKENFFIPMHIRTRYDKRYENRDICRRLSNMGVRYLGVGLESASPEVNRRMHKYPNNPTPEDFDVMTRNCLDAGIKIHHYTVLGFPGETKEELDITRKYLVKCTQRFHDQFYTYTSGMFDFSEGTDMSEHPELYGITLLKTGGIKDAKMNMRMYQEKWATPALERYRYRTSFNLFAYQFFGTVHVIKDHRWMASLWWLIERSGILRTQKFFLHKNPYDFKKNQKWLQSRKLMSGNDLEL